MRPWLRAWKSASRSLTSSWKTLMVISVSPSVSRTCNCISLAHSWSNFGRSAATYVAFQQSNELLQYRFRFSEQSLVDTESLQPRIA